MPRQAAGGSTSLPGFMSLDIVYRHRRLRRTASSQELFREIRLHPADLIAPVFVKDGVEAPTPVASMPGVFRFNPEDLAKEVTELWSLGIRGVAPFPVTPPALKNATGTEALNADGLAFQAIRAIKAAVPGMLIFTDIALDPFTSHGHDGILSGDGLDVDNDATVERLGEMAVLHARAGADFVAPSDMMDGRVGAIRSALDAAGFAQTGILAYSAKFASAYYGPFRHAIGSASSGKPISKRTYQMDPANPRAALADALRDEVEGADVLMVKPAGPYLDVISELRRATRLPIAAYQVSGEYSQIHAAAQLGWLDLVSTRDEALLSIKRARANLILTYFAKEVARALQSRG